MPIDNPAKATVVIMPRMLKLTSTSSSVKPYSPPRRGGVARSARVVSLAETFRCSDHPVCGFAADTHPLRGGECFLSLRVRAFDTLSQVIIRILNLRDL